METSNTTIGTMNVPKGYVYCFNSGCACREQCLRWVAGLQIDSEKMIATTVLPTVLQMPQCPYFRKAEPMRMAWGFGRLFAEVKSKDEAVLREAIKSYLGGNGTYSRYKLGRRMLTPEQQAFIIGLFRKKGYEEELKFDHYAMVYDFDH